MELEALAKKQKNKDIEEKVAFKKLSEFKKACKEALKKKNLQMFKAVDNSDKDARLIFSIKTLSELLKVISEFKIKDNELKFVNITTRKQTKEIPPPDVYAFHFEYKFTEGYLAFYKSGITEKWMIKSFHNKFKSEETVMGEAIRIANERKAKEIS
jgi:transketolase